MGLAGQFEEDHFPSQSGPQTCAVRSQGSLRRRLARQRRLPRAVSTLKAQIIGKSLFKFHLENERLQENRNRGASPYPQNDQALRAEEEFRAARGGHLFEVMNHLGYHPSNGLSLSQSCRLFRYHKQVHRILKQTVHRREIARVLRKQFQQIFVYQEDLAQHLQRTLLTNASLADQRPSQRIWQQQLQFGGEAVGGFLESSPVLGSSFEDQKVEREESPEPMEVEHTEDEQDHSQPQYDHDAQVTTTVAPETQTQGSSLSSTVQPQYTHRANGTITALATTQPDISSRSSSEQPQNIFGATYETFTVPPAIQSFGFSWGCATQVVETTRTRESDHESTIPPFNTQTATALTPNRALCPLTLASYQGSDAGSHLEVASNGSSRALRPMYTPKPKPRKRWFFWC